MKKILILLIIIQSYSCKTRNYTTQDSIQIINQFINQWHKNAKEANFKEYLNALSDDGYYIGTDSSEKWTKNEFGKFAKPYFDKKETWNFKTISRNIFISKNKKIAWFNELLDTEMGVCRGSGVLVYENSRWKIKQFVLSLTIPNHKMNEVKTIINNK